jgi:hypothetical protein
VSSSRAEGGHGGLVAMADLDADADGLGELGDGDPVEAVGAELAGHEVFVGADGDLVGVGVDVRGRRAGSGEVRPRPLRWPTVKLWMPSWWPMTSPVVVTSSPEVSGRASPCSSR